MNVFFVSFYVSMLVCCAARKNPQCNMCLGAANAIRYAITYGGNTTQAAERYCTETVEKGLVRACENLMKFQKEKIEEFVKPPLRYSSRTICINIMFCDPSLTTYD
ncbi:hypothetical protein Aduo_000420 [Ancylostoma duodenale]